MMKLLSKGMNVVQTGVEELRKQLPAEVNSKIDQSVEHTRRTVAPYIPAVTWRSSSHKLREGSVDEFSPRHYTFKTTDEEALDMMSTPTTIHRSLPPPVSPPSPSDSRCVSAPCNPSKYSSGEVLPKNQSAVDTIKGSAPPAVKPSSSQPRSTYGQMDFSREPMLACPTYSLAELEAATDGFSRHRELGRGAFGVVYSGRIHGTPVAVKKLKARGGKNTGYEAELCVLSRIRHPNLVTLMGACTDQSSPCLVYEHLSGGTLRQRLKGEMGSSPLTLREKIRIALQIATGLRYMHSQTPRIVHNDLKPDNIMLDEGGTCKIVDVGAATLNMDTVMEMSGAVGTPGYMDPELLLMGRSSPYNDIFSFGIVLLQLVTGLDTTGEVHEILQRAGSESDPDFTAQGLGMEESSLCYGFSRGQREAFLQFIGMKAGYEEAEIDIVTRVLALGVRCSAFGSRRRPDLDFAQMVLEGCLEETKVM